MAVPFISVAPFALAARHLSPNSGAASAWAVAEVFASGLEAARISLLASPLAAIALALTAAAARRAACWRVSDAPRQHAERGEGVISAAIAVLIIASLGALMWIGFKELWLNAEETTNSEIAKIGQ